MKEKNHALMHFHYNIPTDMSNNRDCIITHHHKVGPLPLTRTISYYVVNMTQNIVTQGNILPEKKKTKLIIYWLTLNWILVQRNVTLYGIKWKKIKSISPCTSVIVFQVNLTTIMAWMINKTKSDTLNVSNEFNRIEINY